MMRVTGISPHSPNSENDSLRMNAFFDPETREIFSAAEQVGYDEEGRSVWEDVCVDSVL